MTEVEKMRNGLLADMSSPELQVRFEHAKKLLARMRGMSTYDEGYRKLLEELVPEQPYSTIEAVNVRQRMEKSFLFFISVIPFVI